MTLSRELGQGHLATGENKLAMAYVLKRGIHVFGQFQAMTVKAVLLCCCTFEQGRGVQYSVNF